MATHSRRRLAPTHISSGRWWPALLVALAACSPGTSEPGISVVPTTTAPALEPEKPTPSAPMTTAPTDEDLVLVEAPPPPFCGDGALNDDEQCDDGGTDSGDGCSSNCLV